jgi:asparagine synthase (glutamine-hydrolysing)
MSGIAGMAAPHAKTRVEAMLDKLAHRSRAGRTVTEYEGATVGAVWGAAQPHSARCGGQECGVDDVLGGARRARARLVGDRLVLERDPFGVAPLYYAHTADGCLCFASEVKALLELSRVVHELPPGSRYDGQDLRPDLDWQAPTTAWAAQTPSSHTAATPVDHRPETAAAPVIAAGLLERLNAAVTSGLQSGGGEVGTWLSGGLDSSAITALVRPHVRELHTFVAGLAGAPDLEHARLVAEYLKTTHHEVVVSPRELIAALPRVIYHLESFDALLVRSSITNFLAAERAAEYVPAVFSGEGGDELFAGYEYLRSVPAAQLAAELLDITGRLHNTALQRVDRSAAAHGLVAHVPFLDPAVADYALRIPPEYKLHDGVEKWILRQAVERLLPDAVLRRRKAKFWEGAGVGEQLADHAEASITDDDFRRERRLPNGWELNTKEELLYWRIFREHFGPLEELSWMGRTKGAPQAA